MADDGSSGLTPSPDAVDGMNCMRPWAPAGETAEALKPDSCEAIAASRDASTPCRLAAWVNRLAYGTPASADPEAAGSVVVESGSTRRMTEGLPTSWTLTASPGC